MNDTHRLIEPPLTHQQQEQFSQFIHSLQKWNPRAHLVSQKEASESRLWEHIAECLCLESHLPHAGTILDIGSGGGFPGVVVALLRPSCKIVLSERNLRKSAFLQHLKHQLKLLNVEVFTGDFQKIPVQSMAHLSCITSRAALPFQELMQAVEPYLKASSYLLAFSSQSNDTSQESNFHISSMAIPNTHKKKILKITRKL